MDLCQSDGRSQRDHRSTGLVVDGDSLLAGEGIRSNLTGTPPELKKPGHSGALADRIIGGEPPEKRTPRAPCTWSRLAGHSSRLQRRLLLQRELEAQDALLQERRGRGVISHGRAQESQEASNGGSASRFTGGGSNSASPADNQTVDQTSPEKR